MTRTNFDEIKIGDTLVYRDLFYGQYEWYYVVLDIVDNYTVAGKPAKHLLTEMIWSASPHASIGLSGGLYEHQWTERWERQ